MRLVAGRIPSRPEPTGKHERIPTAGGRGELAALHPLIGARLQIRSLIVRLNFRCAERARSIHHFPETAHSSNSTLRAIVSVRRALQVAGGAL